MLNMTYFSKSFGPNFACGIAYYLARHFGGGKFVCKYNIIHNSAKVFLWALLTGICRHMLHVECRVNVTETSCPIQPTSHSCMRFKCNHLLLRQNEAISVTFQRLRFLNGI